MALFNLMFLFATFMGIPCLLVSSTSSTTTTDLPILPTSTISAAPSLLPDSPSPALSPDITPLFPSPSGSQLSPTDSSLPTIPSSPSPPNPDAIAAPGPAFSPFGSLPFSSSISLHLPFSILFMGFLAFWLI
ncbi:hypothetical protein M9H77_01613 [Catharanthus roseus]|uniref:Uncharacterized protein n=1 Tax=Catharanthus roseus TaxID=4058 RepID=A0ACC0C626_CATRO|nr:hypothetical protein M9H77_01613 [Catharanthus roseus]